MFTISVTAVAKVLEVDDCHFTMLPVEALNVSKVAALLAHKLILPEMVPPAESGFTITDPFAVTVPHPPVNVTV